MPRNNRLLDFDLMAPHLESVTLGARKHLERPNRRLLPRREMAHDHLRERSRAGVPLKRPVR